MFICIPVPVIVSVGSVSNSISPIPCYSNLRGKAGKIILLPLAWKAATLTELGIAFLTNALRTTCDAGLVMEGKVEESLVE
jgi:hypothetical protein